jgi:hypothetical protein
MEALFNQLSAKCGLTKEKAEQVAHYLKEHAAEIPKWLAGEASKFTAHAIKETQITKEQAEKLFAALKTNGGDWMHHLGDAAKGAFEKARQAVAGLAGGKQKTEKGDMHHFR